MRKLLISAIIGSLILSACNTSESDTNFTYSEEAYNEALLNTENILLDFYAPWCSICNVNQIRLDAALENVDTEITRFIIDYDNSAELQEQFGVFQQSTYIFIKNGIIENAETLGPGLFTEEQFTEFLTY